METSDMNKPCDQIIQLIGEALVGKDPLPALRELLPVLAGGENAANPNRQGVNENGATAVRLLRVEKQGFYVYYHGYVSAPGDCANDVHKQFFFVNGLYVKDDRVLKQSLADAFRKYIKADKYPYAFLYLKIKPYRLDIFPERNEVEFYDPRNVGAFCKDAVLESLAANYS